VTITPGPRRLVGVADDDSKALDDLERRAVRNTRELLRRSLTNTLASLRRSYALYLEALGPMSRDPSGQFIRRPGSYTTAEATAKFRAILADAQRFLPDWELEQWRMQYQADLREATTLGVELASELTRMQRVPAPAPGMGPTTPGQVQQLGQELVAMAQQPPQAVPFAGVNPEVVRAASLQASAMIQGETARFRDQIVQIVGEGASRGWGPKRLERDIRQALVGARDPNGITKRLGLEQRAELIARSELAAAYSGGTLRTAQQRGIAYVRVLASNDERTCPTCAARNGRIYPVDRVALPFHPRCRCVAVEVENEAVTEKDPALRATLLDSQRWQDEHDRGVEAYAEARYQERIDTLRRQIERAADGDRKDALSAELNRLVASGPDMVKARAELAQALRTPTASERRLFGKGAKPLRESVPLFGGDEPPAAAAPPPPPAPRKPSAPPMAQRVSRMKTSDISADPARFQYKLGANSDTGEVGSLRGVQKWNEDLAGVLSVWKDPADGKTYVINGHNRLAAAKRLGADAVSVRYINAATAADARAIGALANIAEGQGTAIDAAKFMREKGYTAADMLAMGIPLKKAAARDGANLASLPDDIWSAVVNETIGIEKASQIGGAGLDAQGMRNVVSVLARRPSASADVVRELVAAEKASMQQGSTMELFNDPDAERFKLSRADVTRSMRDELMKDKTLFSTLATSRAAQALEKAGSQLDTAANRQASAEVERVLSVFDQMKNLSGPVGQALDRGAREIMGARNAQERLEIQRRLRGEISGAVQEVLSVIPGGQPPPPPEAPGQSSLFG